MRFNAILFHFISLCLTFSTKVYVAVVTTNGGGGGVGGGGGAGKKQ